MSISSGNINFPNNVIFGSASTISASVGSVVTFSSQASFSNSIISSGQFIFTPTSTFNYFASPVIATTISVPCTFNGVTSFSSGILSISGTTIFSSTSTVSISNGVILQISGQSTVSSSLQGNGQVIVASSGTTTFVGVSQVNGIVVSISLSSFGIVSFTGIVTLTGTNSFGSSSTVTFTNNPTIFTQTPLTIGGTIQGSAIIKGDFQTLLGSNLLISVNGLGVGQYTNYTVSGKYSVSGSLSIGCSPTYTAKPGDQFQLASFSSSAIWPSNNFFQCAGASSKGYGITRNPNSAVVVFNNMINSSNIFKMNFVLLLLSILFYTI